MSAEVSIVYKGNLPKGTAEPFLSTALLETIEDRMLQKTKRELQMWIDMARESVIDYHHTKLSSSRSSQIVGEAFNEDTEKDDDDPSSNSDDGKRGTAIAEPNCATVDSQVMILNLHKEVGALKRKMLTNQKLILQNQNFLESKKLREDQDELQLDIVVTVCCFPQFF
jgi:hypothetical protein